MKSLGILFLCMLVGPSVTTSLAQTARNDPRRVVPTAELDRLRPFLGSFTTVMEQSGRTIPGTMEARAVVKGFYIERVNTSTSSDGSVDSEIRSLITWDPQKGNYRIWRFVPLVPQDRVDGVGRFEGSEFIEEHQFDSTNRGRQILRNRITMPTPDQVRIVNEIQSSDGSVALRGVIVGTRLKSKE